MESWRKVRRDGFAPVLSPAHLRALRAALAADDPRLLQGQTAEWSPEIHETDSPVNAACAIGFGAIADGPASFDAVDLFFADACVLADRGLGVEAGSRHFLNWFDDTPRAVMIRDRLPEVDRAIRRKAAARRPARAGVC